MSDFLEKYKKRVSGLGNSKTFFTNEAKQNFETYLENAPNSFTTLTRGNSIKFTMIDVTDFNNKNTDEKKILAKVGSDLVLGDIISIQDNTSINKLWLLIDKENLAVESHQKFRAKPINYTLKFIKSDNSIVSSYCYKRNQTNYSVGVIEEKYATTGISLMSIMIPDTTDTREYLTREKRILVDGIAYKITEVKFDISGVLDITASEDQLNEQFDDTYNGIADRWGENNIKPEYAINIQDLTTVNKNGSTSLSYSIKNHGVEVSNPSITVTIANTNIATYNSITKVINGINTGSTTLTFVFHGADGKDYTLTGTIRVIISTSGDVNTYQILTDDTSINGEDLYNVPLYAEKTYYAQRYLNGVKMDATYTVNYTLTNCTTSQFTMTISNGVVSIYNKSAPSGSKINLTIKDNITLVQVIKSITLG